MAVTIIVKKDDGDQVEMTLDPECCDDSGWEEVCYQIGCDVARRLATWWLGIMEERLHQEHQLSGFHLSRSCRRGWKQGKDIYEVRNTELSFDLFQELDNCGARGGIPAMEGPHASRPWVGVLRSMTQAGYRVK